MARPKGTEKNGMKYITEEELKGFFNKIRKAHDIKYDLLFSLMLFMGLRVSEAVKIKLSDINEDSYEIFIRGLKSGRKRTYQLSGRLWKKLKTWLKERDKIDHAKESEWLFPSRLYHDEHLTAQSVKLAFKKYIQLAGLKNSYSAHCMRHTTAILRAKRGESPIVLMKWLRHKNIQSTQVYFEQLEMEKDTEKAHETFNEFF